MKNNSKKSSFKVFSGIICTLLAAVLLWTALYFTVPKVKEWTNEKFHISANKDNDDEEKKALIEENKQLKTRIDDLESNVTNASSKYDSVSEKLKETEEKLATANAENEELNSQLENKAEVKTITFATAADFINFLFVQGQADKVIDVRLSDTSYTGAPRYYEKAVQGATSTTFETTKESYTVSKLNEYILTPGRTNGSNNIRFTVATTSTNLELYCQSSGVIQLLVRDIKLYSDNITTISATFYNVETTLSQFTVRYFA